ncbi:NUDIX hydrolase [Desulfococcaceae bacterium HSG8]|nr:NUDIX hydrolase [Desulfococcaceae bacterium HSG8]
MTANQSCTKFIPEELYDAILMYMPIVCVDIAIMFQNTALLVRRKEPPAKDQWWLPGGRVFKGETMREAARRKAREEVGIDCHVGEMIHTAETIFPDGPRDIPVHSVNICFLATPISCRFSPRPDEHHHEYKWTESVPAGLHEYVEKCLMAAGLKC